MAVPALPSSHDEWSVGRRYLSAESLAKARIEAVTTTATHAVPQLAPEAAARIYQALMWGRS